MARHKTKPPLEIKQPYKLQAYGDFVRWSCIPATFRNLTEMELGQLGMPDWFIRLAKFKTRGELAKGVGCSLHALSLWSQLPKFKTETEQFLNTFIKDFYKPQVDHSFTQKVIKYGDAQRVRLWKELYEGFTEKHEVKVESPDDPFAGYLSKLTTDELREVIALRKKLETQIQKRTE